MVQIIPHRDYFDSVGGVLIRRGRPYSPQELRDRMRILGLTEVQGAAVYGQLRALRARCECC